MKFAYKSVKYEPYISKYHHNDEYELLSEKKRNAFLNKYRITNTKFVSSKCHFLNLDKQMHLLYDILQSEFKLTKWEYSDIIFTDELEDYINSQFNIQYCSFTNNYIMHASKYNLHDNTLYQDESILTLISKRNKNLKSNDIAFINALNNYHSNIDDYNTIYSLELYDTVLMILDYGNLTVSLNDYHHTFVKTNMDKDSFINRIQIILFEQIMNMSEMNQFILNRKLVTFLEKVYEHLFI